MSDELGADGARDTPSRSVRRRRLWWILLSIVILGSGLTAGAVYLEPWKSGCGTPPDPPTGVTKATQKSRDGEKLRMTDSGVWPYNYTKYGERMSFGFEIENPSNDVATDVRLRYRFLDSEGHEVIEDEVKQSNQEPRMTIPTIMPGQKVGVGDIVNGPGPIDDGGSTPADQIEVKIEFESVDWWPVTSDRQMFTDVKSKVIGDIKSGKRYGADDTLDDEGSAQPLQYGLYELSAKTNYCREVAIDAIAVVYRDANGEIIGGDSVGIRADEKGGTDLSVSSDARHLDAAPDLTNIPTDTDMSNIDINLVAAPDKYS